MGVVKVETFDVTVASNGQTHTLTNTVTLGSAFVRNTNWRNMSAGPVGSTSNAAPDDLSCAAFVTDTDEVTFTSSGISQKMICEVWRYTGTPGGPDEFINRGDFTVTIPSGQASATQAVSGIVDRDRCIAHITGKISTESSNNNWRHGMASAYIDANDNLIVERGNTESIALDVHVSVIEFTGINWTVGHHRGGFSSSDRDLYADSVGTSGATVSVDWDRAIIFDNKIGCDSSNNAIEDMSYAVAPGPSSSQITVTTDTTAANGSTLCVDVLGHPGMNVARTTQSQNIPNNNSYSTEAFPTITLTALDEACLEWTGFSDGTGNAHGRGSLSARLNTISSIQSWVHRSNNTGTYQYGAADLSNIDGTAYLVISDVDGDNIIANAQTGVVVSGSGFGASQGTGSVILSQNPDGSGSTSTQTVTNWTDTAITFNTVAGALADSNCYLRVTADDASAGFIAVTVGVPPKSYSDAVTGLNPDHLWTLDGDWDDTGNQDAKPMDAVTTGTASFAAAICESATNCANFETDTTSRECADSNWINLSDETARTMGGWIMLEQEQAPLATIYKEGGGVNNLAFITGYGGVLMAQLADTNDDQAQAYSDFKLKPSRPYHILFRFDYTEATPEFRLFIDGVKQQVTSGNPLSSTNLDSHSGDIVWGQTDSSLEMGGTDVSFVGRNGCKYGWWATWTTALSEADIRTELFEYGALPYYTISTDTPANMQTALDALADTLVPDYPIGIRVQKPSSGSDLSLTADNITFTPGTTAHLHWAGAGTLSWKNINGSDGSTYISPQGGTVSFLNPSTLTITNLKSGSNVRVLSAGTTTVLASEDNITDGVFSSTIEEASVDIAIVALGYQNLFLDAVDTSTGLSFPAQQQVDRQYENP